MKKKLGFAFFILFACLSKISKAENHTLGSGDKDTIRINVLKSTENAHLGGLRLSLGANLDFKNGPIANTIYGRLSFYKPFLTSTDDNQRPIADTSWGGKNIYWECARNKVRKLPNKIGLYAGIYQNRFVSTENTSQVQMYHLSRFVNSDTLFARKISASKNTKSAITNLGVFLSLPFCVFTDKNKNTSVSITASFVTAEVILQTVASDYTYSDTNSIKIKIPVKSFYSEKSSEYPLDKVSETIFRQESYLGWLNFGYTFKNNYIHVFISAEPIGSHYSSATETWSKYFKFYLTVTEAKLGLRIGADLRGDYRSSTLPLLNIFITKDFDFGKFSDKLVNFLKL